MEQAVGTWRISCVDWLECAGRWAVSLDISGSRTVGWAAGIFRFSCYDVIPQSTGLPIFDICGSLIDTAAYNSVDVWITANKPSITWFIFYSWPHVCHSDTVEQPVRTARTFVHQYNSTQYCNTEFFSILKTNITSQTQTEMDNLVIEYISCVKCVCCVQLKSRHLMSSKLLSNVRNL